MKNLIAFLLRCNKVLSVGETSGGGEGQQGNVKRAGDREGGENSSETNGRSNQRHELKIQLSGVISRVDAGRRRCRKGQSDNRKHDSTVEDR